MHVCTSLRDIKLVILYVTLFFIAVVRFGATVRQFKGLVRLNNSKTDRRYKSRSIEWIKSSASSSLCRNLNFTNVLFQ
jgi:hypothetical protein